MEHGTCSVEDCAGAIYGRQPWCEKHYRRHRRTGSTADRDVTQTCTVNGCERPHDARGFCHGHYQRWQRTGDVQRDIPLGRRRDAEPCTVSGCSAPVKGDGLCAAHYQRRRRLGDLHATTPIGATDGRPLDGVRRAKGWITQGYRYVPVNERERHLANGNDYEAEHRLVMARRLGRPLARDENVHHVNGDRLDNRPENLELWSVAQPAGQRVGDKVVYAINVLERYAPERLR